MQKKYHYSESRLLFREQANPPDTEIEEVLNAAQRGGGKVDADTGKEADLAQETQKLAGSLDDIKKQKVGWWEHCLRLFPGILFKGVSVKGKKLSEMRDEIALEVNKKMEELAEKAGMKLHDGMTKAQIEVARAKVREQVIRDVVEYIQADHERLMGVEKNLLSWKRLLAGRSGAISLRDLEGSKNIHSLRTRIGVDVATLQEEAVSDSAEKKANTERLQWGNRTERMLREQLIELGEDPKKFNALFKEHMSTELGTDSKLEKIIQKKSDSMSNDFLTLLLDAARALRGAQARGHRLFEQLTDETAHVSLDKAIESLKNGYPGQAVQLNVGTEPIDAVFRSSYKSGKSGALYLIMQAAGECMIVLAVNTKELAYQDGTAVKRCTLNEDGPNTLTLPVFYS